MWLAATRGRKLKEQNNNGGFNQFAVGLVVGAILGVLYAPKEGKESRQALKELLKVWEEKAGEITGEVKEKVVEVREAAQPIINEIRPIVQEKVSQAAELIEPIAQVVARVIERAKAELNQTVEQVRQEIRENIQKPHPKFFRGV